VLLVGNESLKLGGRILEFFADESLKLGGRIPETFADESLKLGARIPETFAGESLELGNRLLAIAIIPASESLKNVNKINRLGQNHCWIPQAECGGVEPWNLTEMELMELEPFGTQAAPWAPVSKRRQRPAGLAHYSEPKWSSWRWTFSKARFFTCFQLRRRSASRHLTWLRGCSIISRERALFAHPDIEAMLVAGNPVKQGPLHSPLRHSGASYRRAAHRLLLSLVHRPAAARAQSGSRKPSSHGERDLRFANSGSGRTKRSATTTVLCE
jgi:hypothetical protein